MPDRIEDDPPSKHIAEHPGDNDVLIEQLKRLESQGVLLTRAFEKTTRFSTRTRNIAVVAAVAGVLAFVGAGVALKAQQDSNDAKTLAEFGRQYDRASCERGNATRAAQRQQWLDAQTLLRKLTNDKGTAALAAGLVANANKNFPEVDCATLTGSR